LAARRHQQQLATHRIAYTHSSSGQQQHRRSDSKTSATAAIEAAANGSKDRNGNDSGDGNDGSSSRSSRSRSSQRQQQHSRPPPPEPSSHTPIPRTLPNNTYTHLYRELQLFAARLRCGLPLPRGSHLCLQLRDLAGVPLLQLLLPLLLRTRTARHGRRCVQPCLLREVCCGDCGVLPP
jgi:hypothetical protein